VVLPSRVAFSSAAARVVPLCAARVSLPASLRAIPVQQLLPPTVAARYDAVAAQKLLRPAHEVCVLDEIAPLPRRPRVHGARKEYLGLLRRLQSLNMLEWTSSPAAVNGVFTLEKDADSDRFILDARWANRLFVDPPHVELPNVSHMVAIRVPRGRRMCTGKSDLSNFYHHLRLPEWLAPYFAMPALSVAELASLGLPPGAAFPCLATVPMGWSHAVYMAQQVHEFILYSMAGVEPPDAVQSTLSPWLIANRVLHGAYIDDFFLFSLSRAAATELLRRVLAAYERAGLVVKQPKVVWPTPDSVVVLGFEVQGGVGSLRPSADLLRAIARASHAALGATCVSGTQLSVLLGHWTWVLLLRRPALSVLQHCYRYIAVAGWRPFSLWPSVRHELRSLLCLLPLLRADLTAGVFHRVLASDASAVAGGVTSTPCSPELDCALLPLASARRSTLLQTVLAAADFADATDMQVHRAVQAAEADPVGAAAVDAAYAGVAAAQWRTDVSLPWRTPAHINSLELHAALLAVHRVATYPSSPMSRVYLLLDSTVALFALRKGRSSSPELLLPLRKIAAVQLAAGLELLPAWLPSELNPADAPSRLRADLGASWIGA
jgi:hypothetical protein